MNKQIYFDNAASTKVDERVVKEMLPYLQKNMLMLLPSMRWEEAKEL